MILEELCGTTLMTQQCTDHDGGASDCLSSFAEDCGAVSDSWRSNRFVGHTIGIEAREFPFEFTAPKKLSSPFLPETSDVPLEENIVINVEVALVELGFGGIQIEHTLLITKNSFEFMTAEPRHMLPI
jgi:Xaa-Pro aminopeptidase